MVDDPDARVGADAAHLESCAECKAQFANIAEDARTIATLLAVPAAHVDVNGALSRVRSAPSAQPRLGFRLPIFAPASQSRTLVFIAAVAAVALALVAFAYSGLFYRPTTVTAVPITVADMQSLSQLADYGTVTWTTEPNFNVAQSAADASTTAGGLQTPVVTHLPSGISTTVTYGAMSKAVATFTFSKDKAAAAAASHGKTLPAMPRGIDGATLTVTVGPAVGEVYGNVGQQGSSPTDFNIPQLIVARSIAPTASSTQVTVQQLEAYILEQPGISPELKSAIQAVKDPSHTLLIPVPVEFGTSTQVKVQGVDGVALGDNTGVGAGVVWVKNGSVFVVAGAIKQSTAIDIANNLK